MSIDAVCPDCGALSVHDETARGQLVKCPACLALMTVTPAPAEPELSLQEVLDEAPAMPETQVHALSPTATAVTEAPTPPPAGRGCAHCQSARLKGHTACPVCGLSFASGPSSSQAATATDSTTTAPTAFQPRKRGLFSPPDSTRARMLNQMAQADEENIDKPGGFFGPEKRGIAKGVLGGVIMMAIAAIWFFWGLSVGYVYFYPPVLFLIGTYAFAKGLATGNFFGNR